VVGNPVSSHNMVVEGTVKALIRYGFEVHREYRVYYWVTDAGKPRRRQIRLDVVGICSNARTCSNMVVVVEVETEYMDYTLIDRLRIAVESMRPKPTHIFIVTWRVLTYSEIIDMAIKNNVLRPGSTKLYIVNSVQQLEEILKQLLQNR